MPLTAWLAAAAQHMGGDALVGNTVFVFWYGEKVSTETSMDWARHFSVSA
jgi:hypothetical protein